MTEVAIRVENLNKLYRIGPRQCYRTWRDTPTTDNEAVKEENTDYGNGN